MCGRYTLHQDSQSLVKRFNLAKVPAATANYNVAPGQTMPVILAETTDKPKIEPMRWGFVPPWAKDPAIGYKLINARSESLFTKPMWRSAALKRRCLIPADGFYEWQAAGGQSKSKQPFYIRPKDQELFSFAGIWSVWRDPSGQNWPSYSIITTQPNREMAAIHNRMPVILNPNNENLWLDSQLQQPEVLVEMLTPSPDNSLQIEAVSDQVNSASHNFPGLIQPLTVS